MTVTGAPTFNEPFESDEAHTQHHRDLEELGGGPPVDPSTAPRMDVSLAAAQNGNTSNVEEFAVFDATPAVLVGADLEVDAMDATTINVLADGLYSVTGLFSAAGAFTDFAPRIYYGDADSLDSIDNYVDAVCSAVDQTLTFGPWFLEAGQVFQASMRCTTSAGTWDFQACRLKIVGLIT